MTYTFEEEIKNIVRLARGEKHSVISATDAILALFKQVVEEAKPRKRCEFMKNAKIHNYKFTWFNKGISDYHDALMDALS